MGQQQKNYGLVESLDELERYCERLLDSDAPIGFDIETGYHGPDTEKASVKAELNLVAGISFTNSTDWARYAPLGHDAGTNLDNKTAARLLWPVLNSGRGVAHNAKFELRNLARWFRQHLVDDPQFGDEVRAAGGYFPVRSDTQVEAYLIANDPAYVTNQSFGLKPLTKVLFGHEMTELHELFPDLPKNKRKFLRFNTLDQHDPKVRDYACEDAVWCLAIHEKFWSQVKDRFLYAVEHGVIEAACEMEDFGVRYDWGFLRRAAEELREFQSKFNGEIMAELTEMTGEPVAINLGSPVKVRDVLYTKLGMSTSVYTVSTKDKPPAERVMSTGKIALAGLAKQHPIVRKILDWKEQSKLLGTYLDKYELLYGNAPDGHTHPNHLTAFVITGRFAVSDPPYQQSPKAYHFDLNEARDCHARHADDHGDKCRCDDPAYTPPPGTCWKFNFRDAVIAPPEHYIVGFDLSQAELRAIAGEAQETALLEAFNSGADVHTLTAALMLGIDVADVTKKQRDIGKTLNFALMYGMGAKTLADRLGIPKHEAEALFDKYFAAYAKIAAWSANQVHQGKLYKRVTSRFGRVLPIWEFDSDKKYIREKGERACVNYPIQGAATGDYMKIAMVRARKAIRQHGLQDRVHMVMNVHDALEFYVHRSVTPDTIIPILQQAVIFAVPGWPPMRADWHIAKKWGSPVEVELTDDGRLLVGDGEHKEELRATALEEDDEGNEVEVMPEVDLDLLRSAAAPAPGASPRTLIVELPDMPDAQAWARFLALVKARPGEHRILLRTPEGEVALDALGGTDLDPAGDTAEISILLGATKIIWDVSSVEPELLAGFSF